MWITDMFYIFVNISGGECNLIRALHKKLNNWVGNDRKERRKIEKCETWSLNHWKRLKKEGIFIFINL